MAMGLPPIRTDIDDAKRDLDEFGLTRMQGVIDETTLDEARVRLDEQAAGEIAHGCAFTDTGDQVTNDKGGANQRIWNLINKGEVFRRMVMNDALQELARHILGEDLLLFSATANIAKKGGNAQPLHGDQLFAPADIPCSLIANGAWLLDPFTEENGATRVVPKTHLLKRWPDPDRDGDWVPAVAPAGTLMFWDGRLWHGTGVNQTDKPRRAVLTAFARPFMRQHENATMGVAPEVLDQCSPELLTLLGFRPWKGLGNVDGSRHGELTLRPTTFSGELRP